MSESNGAIRISKKGIAKFIFGDADDAPSISVDVIETNDEWYQIDQSFRVDGKVPTEQTVAYDASKRSYVQKLLAEAYAAHHPGVPVPQIAMAEAGEFIARIHEETGKLRLFFEVKSPGQQESHQPSNIRFQQ